MAHELSPDDLACRTIERRAIEAINWGMPAVNYDRMYQAMIKAGGDFNEIVYWSALADWKNQTLTPNADVINLMPFFSTKEVGPIVLEIPPAADGSITGSIMDAWQAALEDVGTAGEDKGAGGKYLILPPNYKGATAEDHIILPSMTYQGFALLRSIPRSGSPADVAQAVAYAKQVKLYQLSQAAYPPPTRFVDVIDTVFDATIPYDIRFFHSLDRMVQYEPWLERDKMMIDMLKSIGIEKGKLFNPDEKTETILDEAAQQAHSWLDARFNTGFPAYYRGTQWGVPAIPELLETMATFYEKPNAYTVDARGLAYYLAFSNVKHLGEGQFYLWSTKDKTGDLLEGENTYHLLVPPDVPVKQYWSATAYDCATHGFIRNLARSNRSSQSPEIRKNGDGSVDIYFGPKAEAGKESNWIPTKPGGNFEITFRFYGPEEPLFDKTWRLPDIEKMN